LVIELKKHSNIPVYIYLIQRLWDKSSTGSPYASLKVRHETLEKLDDLFLLQTRFELFFQFRKHLFFNVNFFFSTPGLFKAKGSFFVRDFSSNIISLHKSYWIERGFPMAQTKTVLMILHKTLEREGTSPTHSLSLSLSSDTHTHTHTHIHCHGCLILTLFPKHTLFLWKNVERYFFETEKLLRKKSVFNFIFVVLKIILQK
jgi:hypothetical protein